MTVNLQFIHNGADNKMIFYFYLLSCQTITENYVSVCHFLYLSFKLLDDNRELFIPETQETIKAHPKFMLFATQNPPGHYGGRKVSLNVVYFAIIVVICNLDIFPLISTNDIVSINEMTDSENYQSSVMSNAL